MRRVIAVVGVLAASIAFGPRSADAGGGCHGSGPASGTGDKVALAMNCMTPRVLHAAEGTSIRFVNKDEVTHNIVGDQWGVEELRTGQDYRQTFVPGTHVFSCTLHPGMVGAVVIGGTGAPIADIAPVRTAASTATDAGSDRLPLGLALGAVIGSVLTVGLRRLRSTVTGLPRE